MAAAMIELSSTCKVLAGLSTGHEIAVEAYTLHGPVLDALEGAARRGAHVTVELEGQPYADGKRRLASENARIVAELRRAGAEASLEDPVHAKEIAIDGALYLDERNWHDDDIVLRVDDPGASGSPMTKSEALEGEAKVLTGAHAGDGVIVESESFGTGNAAFDALRALGRAHAAPRLLVSEADLRGNAREKRALAAVARDGVSVRICRDSAKLAVAGDGAWLGSANATYAGGKCSMNDWGIATRDGAIVDTVRARLEKDWAESKAFKFQRA
jgi:hypothetical protein